jgi:hypothetical protein
MGRRSFVLLWLLQFVQPVTIFNNGAVGLQTIVEFEQMDAEYFEYGGVTPIGPGILVGLHWDCVQNLSSCLK